MNKPSIARVLIIAGSDSGGGAGIQADTKTITMLGGFAATAITAITVQNTLGVSAIHPVPTDIINGQIKAVLDDIGADAIKIGMLGDVATIQAVVRALRDVTIPIVLDPVMVAKGGASLLAEASMAALINDLMPLASLITPNVPELAVLTGRDIHNEDDMRSAARLLLGKGAKAVLAKGGHLEGPQSTDWLVTAENESSFSAERIVTPHTHGTGCTLSSAIACGIAKGLPMAEAVAEARSYLQGAIKAAPKLGGGHGPLGHGHLLA